MGTVENRQKMAAGIPPSAGVLVEGWPVGQRGCAY